MPSPSFISRQIGNFQVTALSDGDMAASLDLLVSIDAADARTLQRDAGISEPDNIHINCYLIRGKGKTILVDSGTGGLNNVGGQLQTHLGDLGVSPEDIDIILLTHAHPDHIGGLIDAEGCPVYKRANVFIHPREVEYWQDDDMLKLVSEQRQRNFTLARRMLKAYEHNLNVLGDNEVIEGIRPVFLPGHTPGHTGFRIDSENKNLLIWGDIVHFPHVQSAQPAASIVFDFNPIQAEETRKNILAQAAREKLLIAGMHLDKPGFVHVIAAEQGYRIAYAED